MLKRIKKRRLRKKLLFIELLDTLIDICLYLYYDERHKANPFGSHMWNHSAALKLFKKEMQDKVRIQYEKGGAE